MANHSTAASQAVGETGQKIKDVNPTLLIGLGGTGKEVLTRIRRMFFERYKITGFPIVKYLWIDTDPSYEVFFQERADDFITKAIAFTENETIDAQVPQDEYNAYFQESFASKYIFEWMSKNLQEYGTTGVVGGARQIRPLGKLAFYHHFVDIRNKLTSFADQLRSYELPNIMMRDYGIRVALNNLKVCVVCSVAGGTGSGMFLDMGFLANNALTSHNPMIGGYFALPNVFAQEGQEGFDLCFANSYAALKELNHYFRRKPVKSKDTVNQKERSAEYNDYCPNWDNHSRGKPVIGPPYHSTYLFSNDNFVGRTIPPQNKHEIFNMIAERIFLDFEKTPFSDQMRSVTANTSSMVLSDWEHVIRDEDDKDKAGRDAVLYREFYPCSYSSFGLAKIYINRDRLQHAASYFLAGEVVNLWTRSHTIPATLDDLIPGYLQELRMTDEDILDEIGRADEAGAGILDDIQQKIEEQQHLFLGAIRDKNQDYAAALSRLQKQLESSFAKPTQNPDTWGDYIKVIESANLDRYLKARQLELRRRYISWLDDIYTGFDVAEVYLRSFTRDLKHWAADFQELAAVAKEDVGHCREDFQRWLNRLQEIQGDWHNNVIQFRDATLRVLLNKAFDHLAELYNAVASMHIFTTSARACQKLIGLIGEAEEIENDRGERITRRSGLMQEGWTLLEALQLLQRRLKEKFTAFEETPVEFRNVPLAAKFDFESEIIHKKRGTTERDQFIKTLSEKFLGEVGVGSIYHTNQFVRDLPSLEEKLMRFAIQRVGEVGRELSALRYFTDQYPEKSHRAMRVRDVMHMSEPWLAKGSNPVLAGKKLIKFTTMKHWGVETTEGWEAAEIQGVVTAYDSAFRRSVNYPDSIVFYSEMAGFPIFFIRDVEKWREIYNAEIRKKPWERHNELRVEIYSDIIPPSHFEVIKLIEASEVFLLGVICKVIKSSKDGANFYYRYYTSGVVRDEQLGSMNVAIQTLTDQDGTRAELLNKVEGRILRADQNDLMRLLSILAYYTNNIFPQEYMQMANILEERRSPEYTCIEKRRHQVMKMLEDRGVEKRTIEHAITQNLKGIDDISEVVGETGLRALRSFGSEEELNNGW
ncbi:hypothetical protein JW905_11015 [bacterium]|nr:hypothetical protein [candidate division CSSED10-310 bacterium]